MWYSGTFSCGHEGRINVTGSGNRREYIVAKKFEGMCEDCYKAELERKRREENERAQMLAKEMELPELQGTKKQVEWANTLRNKFIEVMEECIEELNSLRRLYTELIEQKVVGKMDKEEFKELISDVLQYAIENKTSSSYWIDIRDDFKYYKAIGSLFREYEGEKQQQEIDEILPKEIEEEITVVPEKLIHSGVVTIKEDNRMITLTYAKNEEFRRIVKEKDYFWTDGAWRRQISERIGTFSDRAAEIGNELLRNGFSIRTADEYARKHAVDGDYVPEHKNWIGWNGKDGEYCISWPRTTSREIFDNAKKLPSAKYMSGKIYVEHAYYKEMEDFAEMYGFCFTEKAQKAVDICRKNLNEMERVSAAEGSHVKEVNKLKELLKKDGAILADLVDE